MERYRRHEIRGYTASLAVDRVGNLYASGTFDTIGSETVNHIAKWDGNAWSKLGGGLRSRSEENVRVDALTFDESGNLYAAGIFDTAGTVAANNMAKWDGNAWSALGSGIDYMRFPVCALLTDGKGNLYAGGFFDTAGGVAAKNIAKWDGKTSSARVRNRSRR